jgi:hypothetical protein
LYHPFKGAVLAGDFTAGAINQLKSLGFAVAYFPYETVLKAFAVVGIDASSDETTPDKEFKSKELVAQNRDQIESFVTTLRLAVLRTVKSIRVLPLHGTVMELTTISDAIQFIEDYPEERSSSPIVRYEILVIYVNGDKISGEFAAKTDAIEFLKPFVASPPSSI